MKWTNEQGDINEYGDLRNTTKMNAIAGTSY